MTTGSPEILHRAAPDRPRPDLEGGPIDGVVDQTLRLRETMVLIADPFLLTLTDMLLFELGRHLGRRKDE